MTEFFGGQQLPLAVTFSVMVGVAFVALICDFLKGYNEQLRELVLEMHTREQRAARGLRLNSFVGRTNPALADTSAVARLASRLGDRLAIKEAVAKQFAAPLVQQAEPATKRTDLRAPHEGELARAAELAMSRENGILRPRKTTIEGPAGSPPALTDIRIRRKAAMLARLAEVRPATPDELNSTALAEELCSVPAGQNLDQKNLLDRILAATVAERPLHRERGRARSAVRDDLYASIESRVNSIERTRTLPAAASEIETIIHVSENKLPSNRGHVKLPVGPRAQAFEAEPAHPVAV